MIAEAETGDVALLTRELCEKRERIAAHRIKRGAGMNSARCGRLGDSHSHVCFAARLFNGRRAPALLQKQRRFADCMCCRHPNATHDKLPFKSLLATKFRFVMPMGLLP